MDNCVDKSGPSVYSYVVKWFLNIVNLKWDGMGWDGMGLDWSIKKHRMCAII